MQMVFSPILMNMLRKQLKIYEKYYTKFKKNHTVHHTALYDIYMKVLISAIAQEKIQYSFRQQNAFFVDSC